MIDLIIFILSLLFVRLSSEGPDYSGTISAEKKLNSMPEAGSKPHNGGLCMGRNF